VSSGAGNVAGKGWSDRTMLLTLSGAMLVVIVVVSLLAPQKAKDDPQPTTTNSGQQGAKALYVTLERVGRKVSRWDRPLAELNASMSDAQAARTTLVLAAPDYESKEFEPLQKELKRLLERGGRVLATGPSGAVLLPGGEAKRADVLQAPRCETTPEGPGPLAQVGSVEMMESSQWGSEGPQYRVEQRCGAEALVVRYAVGRGEAVWWSSAWPLENSQLKNDGDLKLTLATLGEGREVVFDESLHGEIGTLWDEAKGLPLPWLEAQGAVLFVLLVLSFSRRRGPLRDPVMLPRSSPLEFAESMGDLYEKGGATSAATEAARRRLMRVLVREAGVAPQTVVEGPEAIAEALQERLGGDWTDLREHLMRCQEAQHGHVTARSALALVKALSEDAESVRARLDPRRQAVDALVAER
jgi:hypothetical protein